MFRRPVLVRVAPQYGPPTVGLPARPARHSGERGPDSLVGIWRAAGCAGGQAATDLAVQYSRTAQPLRSGFDGPAACGEL